MLNTYLLIASIINLIVLIFFVVSLINLMINTRETAENTARIRAFMADLKNHFIEDQNRGENP